MQNRPALPGPWNFHKAEYYGKGQGFVDSRDATICFYVASTPDGYLIAAAPALLEAAHLASEVLQSLVHRLDDAPEFQVRGATEMLRAAIDKYELGRLW